MSGASNRGAVTRGVRTDTRGYALGVTCGKGHTGNIRYAESTRGYWECQGCGAFVTHDDLAAQQAMRCLDRVVTYERAYPMPGHESHVHDLCADHATDETAGFAIGPVLHGRHDGVCEVCERARREARP